MQKPEQRGLGTLGVVKGLLSRHRWLGSILKFLGHVSLGWSPPYQLLSDGVKGLCRCIVSSSVVCLRGSITILNLSNGCWSYVSMLIPHAEKWKYFSMGYKEFMSGLFDENLTFLEGVMPCSMHWAPCNENNQSCVLNRWFVEWYEVGTGESVLTWICFEVLGRN